MLFHAIWDNLIFNALTMPQDWYAFMMFMGEIIGAVFWLIYLERKMNWFLAILSSPFVIFVWLLTWDLSFLTLLTHYNLLKG